MAKIGMFRVFKGRTTRYSKCPKCGKKGFYVTADISKPTPYSVIQLGMYYGKCKYCNY